MHRISLFVALLAGCQVRAAAPPDAAPPTPVTSAAALAPQGAVACSPTCNPTTGACGPLLACTPDTPCTTPTGTITTPLTPPVCHTRSLQRPYFDDGPPLAWTGAAGDPRAACVFVPARATPWARVPLLVFLHGSHGSADNLYDDTSLRTKAAVDGFAIAAMQGRNLHWLGPNPAGPHHDNQYRDLANPASNPDVADLDHLIDTLVARGTIDPHRIYVAGWSNGAFFAQLYAIARYDAATPGGNHVAAAAAYAGADPYAAATDTDPACGLAQYPTSRVPIYAIHRACDALVPCSSAQANKFGIVTEGAVEPWLGELATRVGDPAVVDQTLDAWGRAVAACTLPALCTAVGGLTNHLRWPDGVADGSGRDWEPAMLAFLAAHPHP